MFEEAAEKAVQYEYAMHEQGREDTGVQSAVAGIERAVSPGKDPFAVHGSSIDMAIPGPMFKWSSGKPFSLRQVR